MSGYSCSDCEHGELIAHVRPVDLKPGETIHILEDGAAVITKIGCSNEECSSHQEGDAEEEEEDRPKRKKNKRPSAAAPSNEPCEKSDLCSRPNGHTGRHNTNLAERVEA